MRLVMADMKERRVFRRGEMMGHGIDCRTITEVDVEVQPSMSELNKSCKNEVYPLVGGIDTSCQCKSSNLPTTVPRQAYFEKFIRSRQAAGLLRYSSF